MSSRIVSGPVQEINVAPAAVINTAGFIWKPSEPEVGPVRPDSPVNQQPLVSPPPAVPSTPISAPGVSGTQTARLGVKPEDGPLLTVDDGNVLSMLQNRTFVGKGFNSIFRPRSNKPLAPAVPGSNDNVLQLNLTQETLSFTGSLGEIPNRGFEAQADIVLKGISYVQKINDVANPVTGLPDAPPTGIHFEPGVWVAIPQTTSAPNQGPTLCRMASIPHGTTINAQAPQPDIHKPLPGSQLVGGIATANMTPFVVGQPNNRIPFPSQSFDASNVDRLPVDISKFDNKQVRMRDLLADPNSSLRHSLTDQAAQGINVQSFFVFKVTTEQTPVLGGGTANIAFLGGNTTSPLQAGSNANAFAAEAEATFWIETMTANLPVKGNVPKQTFMPAGPLGPTFSVGPTNGLHDVSLPVSWTQVQYSQEVLLNFNGLSWPHFSVATLAENTVFDVKLKANP